MLTTRSPEFTYHYHQVFLNYFICSNKTEAFAPDQVRLVLFRECDFRGRKLLFDSDAVQKVPVEKTEEDKKFVEVYDGHGYIVVGNTTVKEKRLIQF